jgi:DNA-directed RNA polymerase subunit E'/Rpb7
MAIIVQDDHEYKASSNNHVILNEGDKVTIRIEHETDMSIENKNLRLMITIKKDNLGN